MRARDMIIDFINFVFVLILISFCLIFFIYKDNLKVFTEIIIAIAPISSFAILLLIKSKFDRRELIRRRSHNNLAIVLNITFTDKIVLDIILFSSPLIILLIPFLDGTPEFTDLLQALSVFLIFYFWQKYLFNKDSL